MGKQNLNKIFKNGSKFKLRNNIDFEDPDFEEMTKAVEDEKARVRLQKRNRPNHHKLVD